MNPLPSSARESQTATCPVHQAPAVDICSRCGNFCCAKCVTDGGLCSACVTRSGASGPYFPVSIPKFIVLSVATFGLYELVWTYRNWKRIKERTGEAFSPFWRMVFSGIFNFSLFGRIQAEAQAQGVGMAYSPNLLAGIALALNVATRLPDPWWVVSFATVLVYLPVVAAVNAVNQRLAPGADQNRRFTAWNIVVLLIGGILLLTALVGLLLPEVPQEG